MTAWLDNLIARVKKSLSPSDEEERFVHRGEVFEALVGSEAWKQVLDYLEKLADESLTALRADKKHEPLNSMALQMRWQERELVLKLLQEEVLLAVEQKKLILQSRSSEEEWLKPQSIQN